MDVYKFSFFPRTIRAWNILPDYVVLSPRTDIFKKQLEVAFSEGILHVVPPRDLRDVTQTPRFCSTDQVSVMGAVY